MFWNWEEALSDYVHLEVLKEELVAAAILER